MRYLIPHAPLIACLAMLSLWLPGAHAELLPDLFKKEKIKATIWDLNEQYVRVVDIEKGAPANDHPIVLDKIDIDQRPTYPRFVREDLKLTRVSQWRLKGEQKEGSKETLVEMNNYQRLF